MDTINVLDKGLVKFIDSMGDDQRIVDAARVSYQKGTKHVSDDRTLIRYLMRHRHSTPLEMVEFVFLIKAPVFVIIQLLRHRTASVNSESGRYSELKDEFYVPAPERMQKQSETNKQGSGDILDSLMAETIRESIIEGQAYATGDYQSFLKEGVAKELARINIPVSQYMSLYWKCDLRNIFNFLKLRLDGHAQYEIRVYADAIKALITPKVPMAVEAFEDYSQYAQEFSRQEMLAITTMLNELRTEPSAQAPLIDIIRAHGKDHLKGRELTEFIAKFPGI